MKSFSRTVVFVLLIAMLACGPVRLAFACGISYIEPIYEFDSEPDPPLQEYVNGKIGIVKPTFGYKSLAIAYRYLNGGGFSAYEQQAVVDALRGTAPEGTDEDVVKSVKAWVDVRKQISPDEKLPEIYTEREDKGYNFFPNCTANAFDVAKDTLLDRAGRYGYTDRWVLEWISGQDKVFGICSSGSEMPNVPGPDAPAWLKKDRDYQIAAAYFYSLNFDEARRRFEAIANDSDSAWRETADYLVARTLVRQASLKSNSASTKEIYTRAELQLQHLIDYGGKFASASQKLMGLVKFRTHPEERLKELSDTVAYQNGDENLRQDFIDYAWLMDKFKAQVLKDEEAHKAEIKKQEDLKKAQEATAFLANTNIAIPPEIKKAMTNANISATSYANTAPTWEIKRQKLESGEMITIDVSFKEPNAENPNWASLDFKYDVSLDEIFHAFEQKIKRALTDDDRSNIETSRAKALDQRTIYLGANFRFSNSQSDNGSDVYYGDEELRTELVPPYLRASDLTDWTVTLQTADDQAYVHSLKKWRDTHLFAWLVSALSHANANSPELIAIIADAEKVSRTAVAFPSVAYHLVRLKNDLGKTGDARKLIDEVLSAQADVLPVSARNQFLEFRMKFSETLSDFLKFSTRKPATYEFEGRYGTIGEFYDSAKSEWTKDYGESQDEYLKNTDDEYKDLLPWDDRVIFDEKTADIFNRHFPLDLLTHVVDDPDLPDYLRNRLSYVVWTRAVLLGRQDVSVSFAKRLIKIEPDMAADFQKLIAAQTAADRKTEELWLLLKNPQFTPFVVSGIPAWNEREIDSFTDSWWTEPQETDYDNHGNEFQKQIQRPPFVTVEQSQTARKEKSKILALGVAEKYISGRVFEWAARSPRDPRIPEALYIVATINAPAQYVDYDEVVQKRALRILTTRYPNSPWRAKALQEANSEG